jgi:hypothetical protein
LRGGDGDGNALKAALGAPFHCCECNRTHRPDSSRAQQCLDALTGQVRHRPGDGQWAPDLESAHDRRLYRQAQGLWTKDDEETFERLTRTLLCLSVEEAAPVATAAELAVPDGAARFRTRYDAWLRAARERVRAAMETAAPLMRQLETLLPPAHPAGAPTGLHPPTGASALIPDPASQKEIDRVQQLLGPRSRRVTDRRAVEVSLSRFGTVRRRTRSRRSSTPDTVDRLKRLFSVAHLRWTSSTSGAAYFSLDQFGLDPEFWWSMSLYGGTLTLITRRFTLRPPEQPTADPAPSRPEDRAAAGYRPIPAKAAQLALL